MLIVEDIVDTGLTMAYLHENLATRHPRVGEAVRAAAQARARQVKQVHIDYLGFTIPNKFVVGYGLDFAQRYRNLPYIGEVEGTTVEGMRGNSW